MLLKRGTNRYRKDIMIDYIINILKGIFNKEPIEEKVKDPVEKNVKKTTKKPKGLNPKKKAKKKK